jgi:hypothetical protein
VLFATHNASAQLPQVYFNHVYNVTSLSTNSATLSSRITGYNFKFIGDVAGTNGVFQATNGVINGRFIYTSTTGSNVIYIGYIDKRRADGNNVWGFVFQQTTGGSSNFFLTNPFFETSVTANSTQSLNSGNSESDLNTMRNNQVVLTANYFVNNFSSCPTTPSAAQTFTISGAKLSSSVTVTAPANFEVSKDNITYTDAVSYARASDNTLASSTVYLRMKSIASTGSYSGYVIVSATNAASIDLLATGDVNGNTTISVQPASSVVCGGTATTFAITAAGSGLTYQWQSSSDAGASYSPLSNSGIYTGATTSVLRLSSGVDVSYTGYQYRCIVSGICGTAVTSNQATLTVNSPASISSSPSNATICENANTSFSVTASSVSPSYQWQLSTNNGTSYADISNGGVYSNVGTATLTITGATAAMNGYRYRCLVTGNCANATSAAATLTINTIPATPGTIAGNNTICSNTNQSYSIAAVTSATSYSWIIPNGWSGSSTTNSINIVNSSSSGTLQVRAENTCGNSSYQSLPITVSGTSAPAPDFTINNQEQCLSSNSFTFTNTSTAASGTTISNSAWNFGDGTSSSNTSTPTTVYATAGTYIVSLQVTANNGCVSSINKQVKVNAAPTGQLSGTTSICSGSSASLSISLTGQAPWLLNYTGAASPISISASPFTLSVSPAGTTTYTITSLSDSRCSAASGNLTGSAVVTVNPILTPAVTISSNDADNAICSGTTVNFSSSGLSNQGSSPSYQWLKNGVEIANQTAGTYTTTDLQHNDIISLQMISNSTSCLTSNTVVSNSIQTAVSPGAPLSPLAIAGDTTQCTSLTNQVYSISSVLNASTYSWTVPAGWTITSGGGTTAITVTIGSSSGISNVTVKASNGCGTSTEQILPVSVSSSSTNPITLTSAAGSDEQIKCINTAITPITYSSSGGTNATFSGLPAGVSGSYIGGTISITGTPSTSGSNNYVVTLTGGGCNYTRSGTISVRANNTISLTSASNTTSQTVCINTVLSPITYASSGATNANISGLPTGVSGNYSGGTVTISGTPSTAGSYTYVVTLTGGCGTVSSTGTIVVNPAKTITLASASSSDLQTICLNSNLAALSYTTSGATGVVFSSLPSGVSGSYSGNTATITGAPTVAGTYNFTVSATGGCGTASASGMITVNALPAPATIASNNGPICSGNSAQFSVSGPPNAVLTYRINSGSPTTLTLGNGNGNGTISVSGATLSQTLTLVSVEAPTTLCVTTFSSSSVVHIRTDDVWTSNGNSDVYHTAGNWCKNGVPGANANIVIPVVASGRYPRLVDNDEAVANIQIDNGAKLNLNNKKYVISGAISGDGLIIGGNSASLEFSGTGAVGTLNLDQTNASTRTLDLLKINRTSNGSLTLGTNAIINSLDLTNGHVDIGNNELTVTTSTNANANSYIKISGIGKVKRSIASGTGFTFPVGKSTYNPITIINNTGSSDEFSLNLLDEVYASYDPTTGTGTTVVTGPRVTRTWNINKLSANGGNGIDLVFNWNSGEISGIITNPALYHFESGAWVKQAGTTSSTSTSLTYTGYTGTFSPFSIGDASINLPVSWSSFTASKIPNAVQLNWITASETNTSDFIIEHSGNTQLWREVGRIDAAGNSASPRHYQFIHQNPLKGNQYNYYRILQRDQDGNFTYSKIVSILFNEVGADVQIYPNPAQHTLYLFLAVPQFIRIQNSAGVIVWKGYLTAGRHSIPVHTYGKGIYFLTSELKSQLFIIQ